MSGETIGVDVIGIVRVPKSELDADMSDDEIRESVLQHGEHRSTEELAISASMIREELEGGESE